MAISGKISSTSSGINAKFGSSAPTLTIKSSSAATSLGTLNDIDLTTPEAGTAGATLVYDAAAGTYKAEKVFEYDGNEVTLKGGSF